MLVLPKTRSRGQHDMALLPAYRTVDAGVVEIAISPLNGALMKSVGLIALGLCCIAAPLAAQQDTSHARRPAYGQRGQRGRMGQPRMARGAGMETDDSMMAMMREMM